MDAKGFFVACLVLVYTILRGHLAYASGEDDDVEFFLNESGLQTIVDQVEKRLLSGNEPRPLPNVSGIMKDSEIEYEFKDVRYIVNLDKFRAEPRPGYIHVDMDVRRAFVSAAQMHIKTSFLGQELEYVCSGISVDFDKTDAQNLSGDIGAEIEGGQVKLDVQNISYELRKKDIIIKGPEHCAGLWGTRWAVKWMVNSTLKRFRNLLEEEMVHVLRDVVPVVEGILNEYTENSFAIKFDGMEPLPAFAVNILLSPRSVSIDDEGIRFIMNTEFDASQRFPPRQQKHRESRSFSVSLGDIGFSPYIAMDVLSEVFPDGVDYIELNEYIPAIEEFLTVSTASVVWPSIVNQDLTETYLKVSVRAKKIPDFYIEPDKGALVVDIKNVDFKFQINEENQWKDYFRMTTDARAFTKASIYNGLLSFQIDDKSEMFVDGEFLGEYALQSDVEYDPEMAELILSGIIDFLHGSAPLMGFSIPLSEIAGLKVGAEDVFFDSEYARVRISQSR